MAEDAAESGAAALLRAVVDGTTEAEAAARLQARRDKDVAPGVEPEGRDRELVDALTKAVGLQPESLFHGRPVQLQLRVLIVDEARRFVERHNAAQDAAQLEINHFALLDEVDFERHVASSDVASDSEDASLVTGEEEAATAAGTALAAGPQGADREHWDWREHGALTRVKNQKQCGACWAFAAVEAVESAMAIAHSYLFDLSEQQLVSCFKTTKYGCLGGSFVTAFGTYKAPLVANADLPYEANALKQCPAASQIADEGLVTFSGATTLVRPSVEKLRNLVHQQPVAVAIDASSRCFQFYRSGLLDDELCGGLGRPNHAVVVVGYENVGTKDAAWVVRNSWATSWGERGFVRVRMCPDRQDGCFSIRRLAAAPQGVQYSAACAANLTACQQRGTFVNTSAFEPLPPLPSSRSGAVVQAFIFGVLSVAALVAAFNLVTRRRRRAPQSPALAEALLAPDTAHHVHEAALEADLEADLEAEAEAEAQP